MGSSPSKNGDGTNTSSAVSRLGYAKLLKKLESKNNEVVQLKSRVKALEAELSKYKRAIPPRRYRTRSISSDEKSMVSIGSDDLEDFVQLNPSRANPTKNTAAATPHGNLPKPGDHVVSMWGSSKWQYFTATILSFDASTLNYTIEWDDKDPTGRIVHYSNLALDKVPSEDQIGVGSKVMFHQGSYRSQEVHGINRSGGLRWHQGEITKITKLADGTKRYEGKHTKGEQDGKWVTFKDYSPFFSNYKIDDFRLPPNVFDVLDSVNSTQTNTVDDDEIDIFLSYSIINSPAAVKNKEVKQTDLPPSYEEAMLDQLCDPRDIVQHLRELGVRVYCVDKQDAENALLETATNLKKAKVFIACLSDEYASDDRCRMEFQYAKKTLHLPVIPLVVGTGSFQWKMTVVGMLIAGELYIHFKDRTIQGFKMNELLRSIKRHIPDLQLKNIQHQATGDARFDNMFTTPGLTLTGDQLETAKPDIFFSYCWSNSCKAKETGQISEFVGSQWSDPRLIAEKLANTTRAMTWVDIKRLESAADGMGMFDQIATAITDCKVVVACVSNEYAKSDNCRMEIQFAASSLAKPLIIVVVGSGDEWKETVVGKVAMVGLATIDMQEIEDAEEMDKRIFDITSHILEIEGFEEIKHTKETNKKKKPKKSTAPSSQENKNVFKAPVPGDHVISLHQNWAYFMATVVEFDPTDLVYTVDWDDGDASGRVQSYKDVALDVVPTLSEIGVGSIVLFPQGRYGGTEGNNTGGQRYHQGKITAIRQDSDGTASFDGVHTKGSDDRKWITWAGYCQEFTGMKLQDLRIAPNAMDALFACKQAFNLGT